MPMSQVLSCAPDKTALQAALNAVAARHEVLRMHYAERSDGTPIGIVTPVSGFAVPLAEVTVGSKEQQMERLQEEAEVPFNLTTGPLLRVLLVRHKGEPSVILSVNMHHAVGDAWSLGLLFQDLAQAYSAALAGKQPAWDTLPIQHADYAAWQQAQISGEAGAELRQWWRDYLAGTPSLIQLPLDRSRPTQPTMKAGTVSMDLPDGLLHQADALALDLRVNTQAVLLAALQTVLLRYSGQDDVVVGVPMAGRDRPETQGLVGYFINTLPVRCVAEEEASFADMAKQASQATVDALEHSMLPLAQVAAAANVQRMPGVNPLFQILFQYLQEGVSGAAALLGDISAQPLPDAPGLSQAKMDFVISVMGGQLCAEFMVELYDEATAARLLGSFVHVLEQAVTRPNAPALGSNLLSAASKQEAADFSCGPVRPEYVAGPLVHNAFAAAATEHPDRRCLVFEGQHLSYGQLQAASDALARELIAKGIGRGDIVGIVMDRSFELIAAILGALKAGAGYLPCDPAYPDDRLAIYLEDANAVLCLTEPKHHQRAEALVEDRCPVVDVKDAGSSAPGGPPVTGRSTPEDPCYVIFTSGSTGRPKGCVLPHRGLQDMLPWLVELHRLGRDDVVLFSNTISFDAHVLQVMPTLMLGATLVIAKSGGHLDPVYIASLITQHQITSTVFTVPTLANEYMKAPGLEPPVGCMRSWGLGGEAVPMEVVATMQEVFPNVRIINAYGPTEVTAVTVHHTFARGEKLVVIGRPDANTHAYIVDARLRPVPVGVPGELLLSGPRLAIGYAGRPDLTAEKFIPNPCLDLVRDNIPPKLLPFYQRAYRTGDLVRWRQDSTVEYLGRIDRQVKITGVRIELGEVESALASVPGVEQAAAAAVPDAGGVKRLVGYVTPETASPAEATAHCRGLLVPAMVPSVVVALAAFPLLPNGKVDVRALPAPESEAAGAEEYVAPANELEEKVVRVWEEVLGRTEPLSVAADFFAAGGTSLQVFRVTAALQKVLSLNDVPPILVHTKRTVRALAAALADMLEGEEPPSAPQPIIARKWDSPERPLSSNQEQMWLLSLSGGSSSYNMPGNIILSPPPDVKALQTALDAAAGRHEVLRMKYSELLDSTVVGHVTPADKFHVPLKVVTVHSDEEESVEVQKEAAAPFDLATHSLLRVRLIARPDLNRAVLALTLHHAVGDAWSFSLLLPEINEAYTAALAGKQPGWEPLPLQYADYATWQQEQISGAAGEELRAWWRDYLAGAPSLIQLPADRPRPAQPTMRAGSLMLELPASLIDAVDRLVSKLRINAQAVFLAALQVVLYRYTGQDDVVVGVPLAGRDRPETQGLVGYFINTLPVRCTLSEGTSFVDVAKQASHATLDALVHGALPLDAVVAASGAPRVPGINPLFQVLFQYMPGAKDGGAPDIAKFGDSTIIKSQHTSQLAHAKMDLTIVVNGTKLSADYMAELFDEPTIARLVNSFVHTLGWVVKAPSEPALEGSLLSEADCHQVAEFSAGLVREGYLEAPLIHDTIASLAAKAPSASCLVHEGKEMSYGTLAAGTLALAARLGELGVQPGQTVAVMLERSLELVVAILGVFRAGACYLPCDPSYPDDRLAIYLEDAAAPVVLTTAKHAGLAGRLSNAKVIVLEQLLDQGVSSSKASLPAVRHDATAYVLFTSGSTGRPKGACVQHLALMDHVLGTAEYYALTSADTSLLTITIGFDPHLMQMLPPLVVGGRLVLAREGGHTDGGHVVSLLSQYGVSFFASTPSLALVQFRDAKPGSCSKLRSVMLGGEQLPRELVAMLAEKVPSTMVYNVYGPTEASITATELPCPPDVDFISIGRPVYNMHCYIVDPQLRVVPVGVPGELLLSGPRLATGYMGRPDLTAEKFIPNPCLDLVHDDIPPKLAPFFERAYRTGDLVRWRPDGTIDFLGRVDRQVKITGVRIELGEVESALASAPGVEQAVAAAVPDDAGVKRLVGYVAPETANTAAVTAHCRGLLVPAMVPTIIVTLESLPLLPNGKVDVKALMARPLPAAGQALKPADTGDPQSVRSDLASLLRRKTIKDMSRAAAAALGSQDMASAASTLMSAEASSLMSISEVSSVFIPERSIYPTSTLQLRNWLHYNEAVGDTSRNHTIALVVTSTSGIDGKAMAAALDQLAARYVVLRTRYVVNSLGDLEQHVEPATRAVPLREIASHSGETAEEAALQFFRQAMYLDEDLPIRALLINLTSRPGTQIFCLDVSSVAVDSNCLPQLVSDLAQAYSAAANGLLPPPESPGIQFIDVAFAQDAALSEDDITQQQEYWRGQLALCAGSLRSLLLGDLETGQLLRSAHGPACAITLPLDSVLCSQLRELVDRKLWGDVSMPAIILAALQILVHLETSEESILIGADINTRRLPEAIDMIGSFGNVVPLVLTATTTLRLSLLAANAQATVNEARNNANVFASELLKEAGAPPLQVLLNYSMVGQTVLDAIQSAWSGMEVEQMELDGMISKTQLVLHVVDTGPERPLEAQLTFDSSLFSEGRMGDLAERFVMLLDAFVNPQGATRLGDLSLITDQEQRKVLHNWPLHAELDTTKPLPIYLNVLDMRVRMSPSMPALTVVCSAASILTWGDLDLLSNQLANVLGARGLKRGSVVVIWAAPGHQAMLGLLAASKLGAAFALVDAQQSSEYLLGVADKGGASLVLADRKEALEGLAGVDAMAIILDGNAWAAGTEPAASPATLPTAPTAAMGDVVLVHHVALPNGEPSTFTVTRRTLRAALTSHHQRHELTSGDVLCLMDRGPFVFEALQALTAGASTVVIASDQQYSFLDLAGDQGATVLFMSNTEWASASGGVHEWEAFNSLRLVFCRGNFPPSRPTGAALTVVQCCGPPELPWAVCSGEAAGEDKATSAVAPLPGMVAYVVSATTAGKLRPTPPGAVGHLAITGAGCLMRGGAGNHAAHISLNPFSEDPGLQVLLQTEQLVRWTQGGMLQFVAGHSERAALEAVALGVASKLTAVDIVMDEDALEVLEIIHAVLKVDNVPLDVDLFDLGADSLRITTIVGRIRSTLKVDLSLGDVYKEPTAAALIGTVKAHKRQKCTATKTRVIPRIPSVELPGIYLVALPLLQLIAVIIVGSLILGSSLPGALPMVAMSRLGWPSLAIALWVPVAALAWPLCLLLVTLLVKIVLIGKYTGLDVQMLWSPAFFRWWIVDRLVAATRPILAPLSGTRALKAWYRLLGAKIGSNVDVHSTMLSDFDLITIGSGAFIGRDAVLTGHMIEDGFLILAPLVLGNHTRVLTGAVVLPGAAIDDDVTLRARTVVPAGAALPPRTAWEGSPARRANHEHGSGLETRSLSYKGSRDAAMDRRSLRSSVRGALRLQGRTAAGSLQLMDEPPRAARGATSATTSKPHSHQMSVVAAGVLLTGAVAAPAVCAALLAWNSKLAFVLVPAALVNGMLLAQGLYMLAVILLKQALIGRLKPGTYAANSKESQAVLALACLLDQPLARGYVRLFSGSSTLNSTLRLLGANVDPGAQVFEPSALMMAGAEHLTLGKDSVVESGASMLPAFWRGDILHVDSVKLGENAILSKDALVLPGTDVRSGVVVGAMCCILPDKVLPAGSVWIGCPAICIDGGSAASATLTKAGSLQKVSSMRKSATLRRMATLGRDCPGLSTDEWIVPHSTPPAINAVQLVAPVPSGVAIISIAHAAAGSGMATSLALLPASALGLAAASAATLVAFKHLVAGELDLDAMSVPSRQLALAGVQNAVAPMLDWLAGTQGAALVLRGLGARVGAGAYITCMPSYGHELVRIGDRSVVEGAIDVASIGLAGLNVMEVSVGPRATVSTLSAVSAGAEVHAGAEVAVGALVVRSQVCEEGEYYEGAPAQSIGKPTSVAPPQAVPKELRRILLADSSLPPGLLFLPASGRPYRRGPIRQVLLTGGTGFVGGFILRELLDRVDKVVCVVRAKSDAEGLERLGKNLLKLDLCTCEEWVGKLRHKVVALRGDLRARRLGMPQDAFHELAETCDAIVHNGAFVNSVYSYQQLRDANVGGTQECLRLSATGSELIPIFYISTMGTLPREPGMVITEDAVLKDPDVIPDGYSQGKWVSESLIPQAHDRGVPAYVLRLARIGASSLTGAFNTDDMLVLFLKGCLQLNCFPDEPTIMMIDAIPADRTAKVVADLVLGRAFGSVNPIFHIGNPEPATLDLPMRCLRKLGYSFDVKPYSLWRERLVSCAGEDNALRPLESKYPPGVVGVSLPPPSTVDCTNAGITGPTFGEHEMETQLRRMIATKYLPAPAAAVARRARPGI